MLINCEHPSNKFVTKTFVNDLSKTGAYMHRFSWLKDEEIGKLSHEWNWLVGWYKEPEDGTPKALHYTEGGPWFDQYYDCEYASEWYKLKIEYLEKELLQKDQTIEKLTYQTIGIDNLSLTDQKKN